ncbi:hypothetical protein EVA_08990 [gut metagenome]|uniref:Uncharacterized protein n=1 Tax=gut metagenome TaxID=749906 RepID=J9GRV7_9ZZZZ
MPEESGLLHKSENYKSIFNKSKGRKIACSVHDSSKGIRKKCLNTGFFN